jgi:lysophospholipase L1-like esterase
LPSTPFRLIAAAALAGAGLALAAASPAAAKPHTRVDVVAIGDSYAAGVGAGAEDGTCRRTGGAYPVAWAATAPAMTNLTFAACSGATTAGVISEQLTALDAGTDLVTVTVGANDLALVSTVQLCATQPQSQQCAEALEAIPAVLAGKLPAAVGRLLAAVAEKAPHAKVVVTGYPLPFAEVDNCPGLPLSKALRDAGNQAVTGLDAVLAAQAKAAGAVFVDVRERFAGHELCSAAPWLVGVEGLRAETTLHPTAQGQTDGYLAALIDHACSVRRILAWMAKRDTLAPVLTTAPAAGGAGGESAGQSHETLPVTGLNLWMLVGAGLVLAVAGGVTFALARNRKFHTIVE